MIAARTALAVLCSLSAAALAACRDQDAENLAAARRAYQRLEIGMSKSDACWAIGTACDQDWTSFRHASDFGKSFTREVYTVAMQIHDGKLVHVAILKPAFQGAVRSGTERVVDQKSAPGWEG